ncbi:hypothetical protein ACONUD_02705 [Microbulbifer harenosus]|uniref:hypothetical protein n=1 Tax=Microbulbifer harenosus TaxID=2576840 RepID=UPI003BA38181
MKSQKFYIFSFLIFITGCTTGELYYLDKGGERKLACEVEFVGKPSVDVYAVEYALSLCAKSVQRKGGIVEKPRLLEVDTSIPLAPCGVAWSHELAKSHFNKGLLTKKEYGYIAANIELGLAEENVCS